MKKIWIIFKMIRYLLLSAVLTASSLLVAGALPDDMHRARSVKVVVQGSHGSGFFLDGNTVITAKHLVDSLAVTRKVTLQWPNYTLKGTITYICPDLDIAIISLDVNLPFKPITILENMKNNQQGSMYGYPANIRVKIPQLQNDAPIKFHIGKATQRFPMYSPYINLGNRFVANKYSKLVLGIVPMVGPGMSGAGVISSEGEFIGILSTGDPSGPYSGYGGIAYVGDMADLIYELMKKDDVSELLD